jgi:hypothetical protein
MGGFTNSELEETCLDDRNSNPGKMASLFDEPNDPSPILRSGHRKAIRSRSLLARRLASMEITPSFRFKRKVTSAFQFGFEMANRADDFVWLTSLARGD